MPRFQIQISEFISYTNERNPGIDINKAMKASFEGHGWSEQRTRYWVTSDAKLIRKTMHMSAAEQKLEIEAAGLMPRPAVA